MSIACAHLIAIRGDVTRSRDARYAARVMRATRRATRSGDALLGGARPRVAQGRARTAAARQPRDPRSGGRATHAARQRRRRRGDAVCDRVADLVADDEANPGPRAIDLAHLVL